VTNDREYSKEFDSSGTAFELFLPGQYTPSGCFF
jgi:hypothetical protein